MDILYILGTGSKHNNQELRWSLRSIEKYGKNIDKVFVVGADPGFLSDDVNYIPCPDKFGEEKHKNMLYKIQYAVLNSDISDVFLVSSDDIFVLKSFDANTFPMYYSGKLPELVDKHIKKESYLYQLYNTRNFLITRHISTYKFALHCIHKMDKDFFLNNRDLIMQAFDDEIGIEPNCLVCNWIKNTYPIQIHQDHKIMHAEEYENITSRIGRDWTEFSVGDGVMNEYTISAISKMFPNKSKWEK